MTPTTPINWRDIPEGARVRLTNGAATFEAMIFEVNTAADYFEAASGRYKCSQWRVIAVL